MSTTREGPADLPPPRPIEPGVAGASRRGDDRRTQDASWSRRTFAERRLGNRLDRALGVFAVVLHDRQLAGADRPIDHVVVAASGVWIIAANSDDGSVERRPSASESRSLDLVVGGATQGDSISELERQDPN